MMHTADLEFENRLIQVYGQWVSVSIMSALPRTSLKVTAWSLWLMNTWHYRVSALIDDPQACSVLYDCFTTKLFTFFFWG
jgi:hypothetical protein